MITCTRRLRFDAGHRVLGHEGKCSNLHGHGYEVLLTAQAEKLDSVGRVIDFSVLKDRFDPWFLSEWDHGTIIFKRDQELLQAFSSEALNQHKHWVSPFNPTAEEIAKYILEVLSPKLLEGTGVTLTKVVLFETPNCWATASL